MFQRFLFVIFCFVFPMSLYGTVDENYENAQRGSHLPEHADIPDCAPQDDFSFFFAHVQEILRLYSNFVDDQVMEGSLLGVQNIGLAEHSPEVHFLGLYSKKAGEVESFLFGDTFCESSLEKFMEYSFSLVEALNSGRDNFNKLTEKEEHLLESCWEAFDLAWKCKNVDVQTNIESFFLGFLDAYFQTYDHVKQQWERLAAEEEALDAVSAAHLKAHREEQTWAKDIDWGDFNPGADIAGLPLELHKHFYPLMQRQEALAQAYPYFFTEDEEDGSTHLLSIHRPDCCITQESIINTLEDRKKLRAELQAFFSRSA